VIGYIHVKKDSLLRDATSPLFYNSSSENAIKKVKENQEALKLKGTHQFLVHDDAVNLLGQNINTVKKIMEAALGASNLVGREVSL
jgi:hypothetical protein